MTRLSRDEFAAAFGAARMSSGRYTLAEAVGGGFKAADQAIALSAPDAIEALEELVRAEEMSIGPPAGCPGTIRLNFSRNVDKAMDTAKAVLARYEKEPE